MSDSDLVTLHFVPCSWTGRLPSSIPRLHSFNMSTMNHCLCPLSLSLSRSAFLSLSLSVWHWNVTPEPTHPLTKVLKEFECEDTHLVSCLPCNNPAPSTASTAPFSILVKGLLTETCAVHSSFNRMLFPPSICRFGFKRRRSSLAFTVTFNLTI